MKYDNVVPAGTIVCCFDAGSHTTYEEVHLLKGALYTVAVESAPYSSLTLGGVPHTWGKSRFEIVEGCTPLRVPTEEETMSGGLK